jgi:hypothetical protein
MSGYMFFRMLWAIIGFGMIAVFSVLAFAVFAVETVVTELRYRNRFGLDWQAQFENDIGPVAEHRLKGVASLAGAAAIVCLLVWLYRSVKRPYAQKRSRRHKHSQKSDSPIERIMRYRKKALVGVYFGVIGIGAGVVLSLFRVGIFEDHANEVVLGIFVFLAGFCGVMAGCSAWLKAKGWNEAIVFIGVMPLAVMFVPFVRILVLASGILPVAMVMMPIILVVVVLVLPDKSGVSRRRSAPARWKEPSAAGQNERRTSPYEY